MSLEDVADPERIPVPTRRQAHGRGVWSSGFEFILSGIGYTVGLGNIWRFPYVCFRNGGAAFLVPYFISLLFMALPLMVLELSVGQYVNEGPIYIFTHVAPAFKGIGWGIMCFSFLMALHYNILIAWVIYFVYQSFTTDLPWGRCDGEYNTANCFTAQEQSTCASQEKHFWNKTCISYDDFCGLHGLFSWNSTYCLSPSDNATLVPFKSIAERTLASAEFFRYKVLSEPNNDETLTWLENIHWELALCLVIAWISVALCLAKGIQTSGKVVYFSVTFPYIIMFILLAVGLSTGGFEEGLRYFLNLKWDSLKNLSAWREAATQVLYSFGLATGVHSTLASYNNIHQNIIRDAIIISFMDCFTSLLGGLIVFVILGNAAQELSVEVTEVAEGDSDLAFITLPAAIERLDFSYLWASLMWIMLLLLGLDSQFMRVEALIAAFLDEWHSLRGRRGIVIVSVCLACFLLSLPMVQRRGIFIFEMLQWSTAGPCIVALSLIQLCVLMRCFGYKNLLEAMKNTMNLRVPAAFSFYLRCSWIYISPASLVIILLLSIIERQIPMWKGITLPPWLQTLSYFASTLAFVVIVAYGIYAFLKSRENLKSLLQPTKDFCPEMQRRIRRYEQEAKIEMQQKHQQQQCQRQQQHQQQQQQPGHQQQVEQNDIELQVIHSNVILQNGHLRSHFL